MNWLVHIAKVRIADVKGCLASGDFGGCAAEKYLENRFNVDIVSFLLLNTTLAGIDSDGILHVNIPSISMQASSELEILDQFLEVVQKTRQYYCETLAYEPIDWRDYFYDMYNTVELTTDWSTCQNVHLEMSFILGHFTIDTSPSWSNSPGGDTWLYTYAWESTSIPGVQVKVPISCTTIIESFLYPDCP